VDRIGKGKPILAFVLDPENPVNPCAAALAVLRG